MTTIEQTDSEKMKMYMRLDKEELIKMLIQANKIIQQITPAISVQEKL